MRQSMTGFASGTGAANGLRWTWDLRSVNGKGLDIRCRLPDWVDGLEAALKAAVATRAARGNIQLALRLQGEAEATALALNPAQMRAVLDAMTRIEAEAMEIGLTLAPSTAADIVAVRGVLDTPTDSHDPAAVREMLVADFATVLGAFAEMRASEGAALQAIITAQLDQIETLATQARGLMDARRDEQRDKLAAALTRVLDTADRLDEARVAQELALIAVKADVTEELDRLDAHVAAARKLLASDGPIGRKFDFLMQEFNREANTLCSKSQSSPLTAVGLELKTVIDQLREQVQNVE